MSTRRRVERRERKNYEWLERILASAVCDKKKANARAYIRLRKKVGHTVEESVGILFDELWTETALTTAFVPWEQVRTALARTMREDNHDLRSNP